MSLKAFHIVFIAVSIALSAFMAVWGVVHYRRSGATGDLALALSFVALGGVLVVYSNWFVRKLRALNW
ncbi:MAG: hypothetical protein HOP29_02965 [Phycisphaerales bacterium]|nr:hypothetical protein [Phycisphaerales bacterium]